VNERSSSNPSEPPDSPAVDAPAEPHTSQTLPASDSGAASAPNSPWAPQISAAQAPDTAPPAAPTPASLPAERNSAEREVPLAPAPLSEARPIFVEAPPPSPPPAPPARQQQASVLAFFSGCLGAAILAFVVSALIGGLLALFFSDLRDLALLFEPPSKDSAARATIFVFGTFVVIGAFGLLVGGALIGARRVSAGAGIGIGAVLGAALTLAIWMAIYLTSPG
jgi:hypothetical protein